MSTHAVDANNPHNTQEYTVFTWNIENLNKNKFALKHFVETYDPDFILLNEVQIFNFDSQHVIPYFQGEYCHHLNSQDNHDPGLGLFQNKAQGGTMMLWKKSLNKFITILPTKTSSFLPVLFHPPGHTPSVQIAIYLPTSGRETEFVHEITELRVYLEDLMEAHPDYLIYIRGDSNVNPNNISRKNMFESFLNCINLKYINISHKTYHHFVGGGVFDSNIDVILHSAESSTTEQIGEILCGKDIPLIESHHDIIVSSFSLPKIDPEACKEPSPPPVIENSRIRTVWADENIENYQDLINDNLDTLRERWLNPNSRTSVSILLEQTSNILKSAAMATNKYIANVDTRQINSKKIPKLIKKSNMKLLKKIKWKKNLMCNKRMLDREALEKDIKAEKSEHRRLVRKFQNEDNLRRDKHLSSFLVDPSSIQKMIRASKSTKSADIQLLNVDGTEYVGEHVKTGFFKSISSLKKRNTSLFIENDANVLDDYRNILDICMNKRDIPFISFENAFKILCKMKKNVADFSSITTNHFLNLGEKGIEHFFFLMNCIIHDVNNASIEELNNVYALLLHKGHGKSRTISSAYRTISTCPLLSKALDFYIRDINIGKWNQEQALTQYQGEASSHELAALLVTELVQHSLYTLKEPAYLLFLDAKSAFDNVKPEILTKKMYSAGMEGHSLVYINERLTHRRTYLDWDRTIMGPILDDHGLEQGGIYSSGLYKIYNNELFTTTHESALGIPLSNNLTISSIGQADDSVLAANRISNLANILILTKDYCQKYQVTLCSEKTKLLRITNKNEDILEHMNPIMINGNPIEYQDTAEHVGIIRSKNGNLPNLMNRFAAHRRALAAVLFTGVARKHRANPAIGLKIEQIYGTPVLMSGLASLVLLSTELSLLEQHHKVTYQNIQKLLPNTPSSVVYFLGGCLPGTAVLHLKQLSIFGMVTRLQDDPLNIHARKILTSSKISCKSWFIQLRDICLQYQLPHPLKLLDNPPSKDDLKKMVKARVLDYWETRLRGEASLLQSLIFFKPNFMSLSKPHPIWTTTGGKPHEVAKAVQQARLLSGRYRTNELLKHWNHLQTGLCSAPGCDSKETVTHIIIECRAYTNIRQKLLSMWLSTHSQEVYTLVLEALTSTKEYLTQFILDCSSIPQVIKAKQKYGEVIFSEIFRLTRTWCFTLHRERLRIQGRWVS